MTPVRIDLLNKKFGNNVIFYDMVGKYGDWLFKQPIILSFMTIGYLISFWRKNNFYPIIKNFRNKTFEHESFAVIFTRKDFKNITAIENVLNKHKHVLEIQRISRTREIIKYWKNHREYLLETFESLHEEQRIETMLSFLKLPIAKRQFSTQEVKNKNIIINFNVGENFKKRLHFNIKEIIKTLFYAEKSGYSLFLIKQVGDDVQQNEIGEKIIERFKDKLTISKTLTFKDACNAIDNCSYYFGADSGLAHYAVQSGKIVFALFNSKYHGDCPLFNTRFPNHFIFHGDIRFSKKVIKCLKSFNSHSAINKIATKTILDTLQHGQNKKNGVYDNSQKIKQLAIKLAVDQKNSQERLAFVKKMFSGIFLPDYVWEVDYNKIKKAQGKIFVDSFGFTRDLIKILSKSLSEKKYDINIFAKNSSFFYGTALKRAVSDIDFMMIWAPSLHQKQKSNLLYEIKQLLKKNNFSVNLPHQIPTIAENAEINVGYHYVVKDGEGIFSFKTQTDYENLEKYMSRIKLKIILNEINEEELKVLTDNILKTNILGKRFLDEIDNLKKDRHRFDDYRIFVRKIESLLGGIGGFGSKGSIVLRISKEVSKKVEIILTGLMKHGIVYVNGNKLYINWDIRRPQNAWFIPISLVWENDKIAGRITDKAFWSDIYKNGSFRVLKEIRDGKLTPELAIDFLESKSYLIISEVFNYLKTKKKIFKKWNFKTEEIGEFLKTKNSDCNYGLDKKINLFGLISRLPLVLNQRSLQKLSKYNLFVQFFNDREHVNIKKTKFFKNSNCVEYSAQDFTKQFINNFVFLLREYYLYRVAGIDEFFLEEKIKEILFNYFVQGKNLMSGPKKQSRKIEEFLRGIEIKKIVSDQEYLEFLIKKFSARSVFANKGKFILLWALEN